MQSTWRFRIVRGVLGGFLFAYLCFLLFWAFGGPIEELLWEEPDLPSNWLEKDWEVLWIGFAPGAMLWLTLHPRPTPSDRTVALLRSAAVAMTVSWLFFMVNEPWEYHAGLLGGTLVIHLVTAAAFFGGALLYEWPHVPREVPPEDPPGS